MAEQLTAGSKLYHGTIAAGDLVGIIKDNSPSYEGSDEEVSGLNDTNSEGIIRQKMIPVDVNGKLSFSGIVDREVGVYAAFHAAMKDRTKDTVIGVERADGSGVDYTGHATSYKPEDVSRDAATAKFSVEFQVNSDSDYTAPI